MYIESQKIFGKHSGTKTRYRTKDISEIQGFPGHKKLIFKYPL